MVKANHSTRTKGFTLVELLVVVGIIVVLLAILVPTFRKIRDQALSVQCLSNLRQVSLCLQTYAADYAGVVAANGDNAHPLYWYDYLDGTGSNNAAHTIYMPQTQTKVSGAWVYTMSPISYCPAANQTNPGTYAMYSLLHKDTENAQFPAGTIRITTQTYSFEGYRVTQVTRPADFLLLADSSASMTQILTKGLYPDTGCPSFCITGFSMYDQLNNGWNAGAIWMVHNTVANGLFADFHAEPCNASKFLRASNSSKYNGMTGVRFWELRNHTVVDHTGTTDFTE